MRTMRNPYTFVQSGVYIMKHNEHYISAAYSLPSTTVGMQRRSSVKGGAITVYSTANTP